ncbi:MAG TPA: Maf family protein [Longimicrobiales bacterium]|nr:Maf family protein [Longimicrobiales bacterium]
MSGARRPAATGPVLVLASQSPRRAQLLEMLGLHFSVAPTDIDETWLPAEEPGAHVARLAREKAEAAAARLPHALVIGSDTVVVLDRAVLGKPCDAGEALEMLLQLQGRTHEVATAVAITANGATRSVTERVRVHFRSFDETTARAYIATGEPLDKAGAYGIQGRGATLVDRIDGDYFAVMGFPIVRFIELLRAFGWCYDFRALYRCGEEWSGAD